MNLKVIMEPKDISPDVHQILHIDLMDKSNPQFTLRFYGDSCKDKELVKQKLDDVITIYIDSL